MNDYFESPPHKRSGEDGAERQRARFKTQGLTSMNEPVLATGGPRVNSRGEEIRSRGRNGQNAGTRASAAARSDRPASGGPGKKGGRPGFRRARRIAMLFVMEIIALSFIFVYAYGAKRWRLVQRPEFEADKVQNQDLAVETVQKMKGYWTVAVFGVDSRGKNVGKGTNADVNMICNINQDTGEIKLVSVFRDTYLNISDNNTYNKLNMAYSLGGPEQAVKALNKNLDLNITDYMTFNWKAVANGIDILGGIEMEISKDEFRYINSFITETVKATGVGSNHLKKAGMNHLDGVQAVAYGRLRLMDTDFARTERQRKVIEKAFEKAKKADYSVLNNILVVVLPQVATSLDFQDLTNVALNMGKYHIGETGGFPFARGNANMGRKGACVIPQTLESNVSQLHQFLFGDEAYVPTSTVRTINNKIAADTGLSKAGKPVGHVATDGGYSPKETKESKAGKADDDKKSTPSSSKREEEKAEETKSGGSRPGGDASGWEAWPTDENGRPVDPAWGSGDDPDQKPGKQPTKPVDQPSKQEPATTEPDVTPGQNEPGGGKPSDQTPGSLAPGQTQETQGTAKPGESPTVAPSPVSPGKNSDTESPGPGGSANTDTGVIIGAPGSN